MIDLGAGGTGVGLAFGEAGFEFGGAHAEAAVGDEAGDEVVALALPGTVGAGGGDGVFLDHFVRGLASDAALHRRHHDRGAEEEGQVMPVLPFDHGGVRIHLVEDRDEGLEEPVDREEGVGQHDAAHHGAGDVAFIPLVPGEGRSHREMTAEDDLEAVDAFAAPAIHLVRHG